MQRLISAFKGQRVAVWGDFILDEYIYTRASRVSREAPVLISEFESQEFRLGGAGNVAANIRTLGGEPFPIGFIGNDDGGEILRRVLDRQGICDKGLVAVTNFTTPRKTRILSGDHHTRRQQVLRIDRLNRMPLTDEQRSSLLDRLAEVIDQCGFLVISDYLNCSVRPDDFNVLRARSSLPPVAVDSRRHLRSFTSVRVATPNLTELQRLFPESDFQNESEYLRAAMSLHEQINSDGLLLKRGDEGMLLLERNRSPQRIGIYGSREIVDVTGAGDTVIAVIALGQASGGDLLSCARLATVAAGLSVMKAGAATITPAELEQALTSGNFS